MDPVTLTTTIITIAGAVCTSYERISSFITLVRNASKALEGVRSRTESINSIISNLRQALEESVTRKIIEKDELALKHVSALKGTLKAVEGTLGEVVNKLMKQYQPTSDGEQYKIRWQYYLNTSSWEELQTRLNFHVQVLGASMQGLNTLNVLRILGTSNKDPARTLRTYAKSILESPANEEGTLINPSTPPSLQNLSKEPQSPLPLDERRLLARKKVRLQRELLHAARAGDYLDVSILLGEGVETEWTEENEGKTALHFAAQYGHLRVTELLLEAGADVEARSDAFGHDWVVRTEKGRTPLIWAAAGHDCPRTQERMCRLLLEKGSADVNARNIFSRTALQEAGMSVRFNGTDPCATIGLLLKHGAYVNARDQNGWTALTECGLYGEKEPAELLLAYGAHIDANPDKTDPSFESNPDLAGKFYETPLVVCGEWSWNEDLICLFLEKGADIESKSKRKTTMAEMATAAKRGIVLDALEKVKKNRPLISEVTKFEIRDAKTL